MFADHPIGDTLDFFVCDEGANAGTNVPRLGRGCLGNLTFELVFEFPLELLGLGPGAGVRLPAVELPIQVPAEVFPAGTTLRELVAKVLAVG